jgi:hypothetical protein
MTAVLRERFDDEMRRRIVPAPGSVREQRGPLVWVVGPSRHPLDHMVAHSHLTGTTADAVLDEIVADARRGGYGVEWIAYAHDDPPDLEDRLARRGFAAASRETVLVVAADDPRVARPARDGVSIRRIEGEKDARDVIAIQEAVWGTGHTEWLLRWFRASWAGEAEPIGVFVADVDGEPAGIGWTAPHSERSFAFLFGGTVLPRHRGRGAYGALVAARARFARGAGAPYLVTSANENSAPRLARFGFEPIATCVEMVLPPS